MKPILFSTPMVQAILDGRKTQTRRVIKDKDITNWFDIDVDGKPIAYIDQETGDSYPPTHRAKYQPGDILWVRETWAKRIHSDNRYYYKADNNLGAIFNREDDKWRPSIFMPREAARIFLRVKNVRVERVQDIGEEDALAEGVEWLNFATAKEAFTALWDGINGKRVYGWDTNPWVWVVEFEHMSKGEALLKEMDGMIPQKKLTPCWGSNAQSV